MKIVKLSDLPQVKASHGDFFKKVMIHDNEIPHVFALAQVSLLPGQVAPDHGHNGMFEVYLIEQGKVKLVVDGEKEYIAEKGACIITEPQETHEVSNPFDETLVITYFQLKV